MLEKSGNGFLSAWKTVFKALEICSPAVVYVLPPGSTGYRLVISVCMFGEETWIANGNQRSGGQGEKHQEKRKRSNLLPKSDVNERVRTSMNKSQNSLHSSLPRSPGLFYTLVKPIHRFLSRRYISISSSISNLKSGCYISRTCAPARERHCSLL